MNIKIQILVEGPKDRAFITSYLQKRYMVDASDFSENRYESHDRDKTTLFTFKIPTTATLSVHEIGGIDKFESQLINYEDKSNSYSGVIPVAIFDTDTLQHLHGGVEERVKYLTTVFSTKKLQTRFLSDLQIFLLPNHREEGDLETLLEKIASPRYTSYFSGCWYPFERALDKNEFHKPSRKSRMNEYVSAVKGETAWKDRGQEKALFDDDLWDWDSPSLAPLDTFFTNLFDLTTQGSRSSETV